jgi:hypothetical protein
MELVIRRAVYDGVGAKAFEKFGVQLAPYSSSTALNIGGFTLKQLDELEKALQAKEHVTGVKVLLRDIATWRKAMNDAGSTKARSVKAFRAVLYAYLRDNPGPRLYRRVSDEQDGVWVAYYVKAVTYVPPERSRGYFHPDYVEVDLVHERGGTQHNPDFRFYEKDIVGKTTQQALAEKGYFVETEELRERYLEEVAKFSALIGRIGTQCLAVGDGTLDLDGNKETRNGWWRRAVTIVKMTHEGQPSRVVVDVFVEGDSTDAKQNRVNIDVNYWRGDKTPEDEDEEAEQEPTDDEVPVIEIPLHPYVATFDLRRHMRMSVHVRNLTEYEYDETLADKLVLAEPLKRLVTMLVEHKDAGFRDIVGGKAGGAVVLLGGPPGVGKTLTAEVYAESEKRALYSVQCSQLGTTPEDLEAELLKVFARAKRWNAVLLLDEADVYVHERGDNMEQNAIVGVFLRVLEYQSTVMFLTTNRPQDVDDAVASRCLARLTYRLPTIEEQKCIWQVLAKTAGAKLDDSVERFAREHPELSGRDVKNLLKLGMLIGTGKPITRETLEYVKQFQPTAAAQAK